MSTDRETTLAVRSWLEAGVTRLPDRVLDAVLDQVPATPQRRSWWPARRSNLMNIYAKLAVAAAAVLVIAVAGSQLLPGRSGPGVPTSAPSPAATPEPTEVPRLPGEGPIDAGTYQMGSRPTFLVTVPAGWVSLGGFNLRKHADEPTELALDTFAPDLRVFADACQSEGTGQAIGASADDLVAALRAQANSEVSDPVEVPIGRPIAGYYTGRATRLDISVPAGLDLAGCSNAGLQIWVDSTGENYLATGDDPAIVATVYIVDTGSGRLVFLPHHEPDAPASDVTELNAIVASIEVID
jgi:hypothetical protein